MLNRLFFLLLLVASAPAHAVVVRHDVPDARYLVAESMFPALVDLPNEGHGVLIDSQWVVTAAHAIQWAPVTEVMIEGKRVGVEQVRVHPGFKNLREELAVGDAAPLMRFLSDSDDIALIKLATPIANVRPVLLYTGNDELGRNVLLYGKGATGNGMSGQAAGNNRTLLRRAENVVSSVESRWLVYTFDSGDAARPLEGMLGNGDSGSPVLLEQDGQWKLAGLASWKFAQGELSAFRPGLYGQRSYQVRISHYAAWIRDTLQNSGGYSEP